MALAEAMARRQPIVTTTGGAAAQTVPDSADLKIPLGDVAVLRARGLAPAHQQGRPSATIGGRVMARRTGAAAIARFRPPHRRGLLGDGVGLNLRRRADGRPRFSVGPKIVEKQSR
jgi:hypothetical protein